MGAKERLSDLITTLVAEIQLLRVIRHMIHELKTTQEEFVKQVLDELKTSGHAKAFGLPWGRDGMISFKEHDVKWSIVVHLGFIKKANDPAWRRPGRRR